MNHQDTYRHNEAYAEFLAGWDAGFYAKYADTLRPARPAPARWTSGCGVGQVVARLTSGRVRGATAWMFPSRTSSEREVAPIASLYDGRSFPSPTTTSPAWARSTCSNTSRNPRRSSANWCAWPNRRPRGAFQPELLPRARLPRLSSQDARAGHNGGIGAALAKAAPDAPAPGRVRFDRMDADRQGAVHAGRRRHRGHQPDWKWSSSSNAPAAGWRGRLHRPLRGQAGRFPAQPHAGALPHVQRVPGGNKVGLNSPPHRV